MVSLSTVPVSLETIQAEFHQSLERFIRNRVPDADTAQDLLQEVYLKIYRHLDTLCQRDSLQAWIYQIARNVISDYYRRRRSQVELDESFIAPESPGMTDDFTERLKASVRATLECMPEAYRQALILTEFEGLTQHDLAARVGLSISGAKSRVQRAKKMLRDLLLECCHFQLDRYGAVVDYYPRAHSCAENNCA